MKTITFSSRLFSPQPRKVSHLSLAIRNHPFHCRANSPITSHQFRSTMSSTNTDSSTQKQIFNIDPFAHRHWDKNSSSSQSQVSQEEFLQKVHEHYYQNGEKLVDGYAPFCKHVFVPNFAGMMQTAIPITDENRKLLQCDYVARREDELPVLSRWFQASDVELKEAKFLDIILYSREQIKKENAAMGHKVTDKNDDIPWGIISIKAQDEDHETPMQPITMLRNAVGAEEGGSGVAIDKEKYQQSVAYWKDHATVQ